MIEELVVILVIIEFKSMLALDLI